MVMLAMGPGAFETWLLEANRDQLEQGCMDPAIGLVKAGASRSVSGCSRCIRSSRPWMR